MDYSNLVSQAGGESALAAAFATFGVLIVFLLIIGIALLVVYIIGLVKLFQKAKKPGWAAIIPFYNSYVLVEIAGLYWWYFLIAIAGTIFSILGLTQLNTLGTLAGCAANFFIFYNLAKKMHKEPILYGVLAIFFAPIMAIILGFGSAEYDASIPVSPNGPIGENNKPTNDSEIYCLGCGKKLSSNTKFCENCGKEVPKVNATPVEPQEEIKEEVKPEEPQEEVTSEEEPQEETNENAETEETIEEESQEEIEDESEVVEEEPQEEVQEENEELEEDKKEVE